MLRGKVKAFNSLRAFKSDFNLELEPLQSLGPLNPPTG